MKENQPTESQQQVELSIIIPTYNESENILKLIESIRTNIPSTIFAELIVVDDNSPDGTGGLVDDYISREGSSRTNNQQQYGRFRSVVRIIHRDGKGGLIPALLQGIKFASGENILIMDADFSHPPEIIHRMFEELKNSDCDLVVASRYVEGGSIVGWPFKRRLISKGATNIARHGLNIKNVRDPMSGFFIFRRQVIENIPFDTSGYKILLELLVKARGVKVKEVPYTFLNRKSGASKLDTNVIFDYIKAAWKLYRYGQKSKRAQLMQEKRKSVLFLSKAARFYTVGVSGFLVNYLVSILLSNGVLSSFFYLHATLIGIISSITSNFVLNKAWTFEDRDFSAKHTLKQYGLYVAFSSVGAVIQMALLYMFVESYGIEYSISLIFAVAIASISNFLFNKKWTFREKIWG
ncbi:MAG: glycosyltransferase [Nitrososphaerales archaeon]